MFYNICFLLDKYIANSFFRALVRNNSKTSSSNQSRARGTGIWNRDIQSNLVISNSLISNYRLSRSENLIPVLTWNYDNRLQNNVEKRRNCFFPHYFNYIFLTSGVKLHIHLLNMVVLFYCFTHSLNSDMSRYGYLEEFQWVPWNSR